MPVWPSTMEGRNYLCLMLVSHSKTLSHHWCHLGGLPENFQQLLLARFAAQLFCLRWSHRACCFYFLIVSSWCLACVLVFASRSQSLLIVPWFCSLVYMTWRHVLEISRSTSTATLDAQGCLAACCYEGPHRRIDEEITRPGQLNVYNNTSWNLHHSSINWP